MKQSCSDTNTSHQVTTKQTEEVLSAPTQVNSAKKLSQQIEYQNSKDYSVLRYEKIQREGDLAMERLYKYMDRKYKNYRLEKKRVSEITPSQFGQDYINASSKYTAQKKRETSLDGELDDVVWRIEDLRPIVVDEKYSIID